MNVNNPENVARAILVTMPCDKVHVLKKALERNMRATSSYMLERGTLTKYKEGLYVTLTGVNASFSVFYSIIDKRFCRKPAESKLTKVDCYSLCMDESQFCVFHSMK